MSRPLESTSRQWPSPGPVPPDRPFAAFPSSRSPELKWTVSSAPSVKVSGPRATPPSSNAWIETSPARAEWLITRTNPWRPRASDADGKRCTGWALSASPDAMARGVQSAATATATQRASASRDAFAQRACSFRLELRGFVSAGLAPIVFGGGEPKSAGRQAVVMEVFAASHKAVFRLI